MTLHLGYLGALQHGECTFVNTPMVKGDIDSDGASVIQIDLPYTILIGSLQYAAVMTRPDISMAMPHVSRSLAQPSVARLEGYN